MFLRDAFARWYLLALLSSWDTSAKPKFAFANFTSSTNALRNSIDSPGLDAFLHKREEEENRNGKKKNNSRQLEDEQDSE